MNDFVAKIKDFSKHVSEDIGTIMKDFNNEKVEFADMVSLIIRHEKTTHMSQTLLGSVYNTYQLHLFPYYLHLETKGKMNESILQLMLHSQERELYCYRSYEAKSQKPKIVPVPEPLINLLKTNQHSNKLH
ncbi:hypothetical protein [Bacillus sp. SG-1]|uniref:hypothetical protein n=1 Tax=Bacillus sp. SG-1 TaxID=161544 RepID=UPI00015437CE|nr:hypothetical protein [Bacillus sp. SG-1]EDL65859.1 hypothetical protein BSG1_16425 [Bacillus sp. SG-1]